jgi:hypothetical protein
MATVGHVTSGAGHNEISGRLIFVGESVRVNKHAHTHAHRVQGEGGGWTKCLIRTDGWLL